MATWCRQIGWLMVCASIHNEYWPTSAHTNRGQLTYSLAISKWCTSKTLTDPLGHQVTIRNTASKLCLEEVIHLHGPAGGWKSSIKAELKSRLVLSLLGLACYQWPKQEKRVLDWHTCFNFRVVSPFCHLLLADEVVDNSHTDWRLGVVPLHDDQWAAGFVGVRQLQPGNTVTDM